MNRRNFIEVATMGMAGSLISGDTFAAVRSFDAAWYARARRHAKLPMGKVAYVEHGMGGAALFLHGFPLNNFQWRGALPELSFDRRCIAPDFLAMGHTETPEGQSVGPEAQLAMLLALMDELEVEEFDVVASDSGGAVAQLLVAQAPNRVRSLLLTNCDTEIDSPPPAFLPVIKMSKAGAFVDQGLVPQLRDKSIVHTPQGLGGQCYSDPFHPTDEAIDYYFTPLASTPLRKAQVHGYAIALEKNPLEGIGPALRQYGGPVRVVWGMADRIFSPRSPDHLDRAFTRSQGVRRLEGRGLFWPEERPDIIAEEARKLWAM